MQDSSEDRSLSYRIKVHAFKLDENIEAVRGRNLFRNPRPKLSPIDFLLTVVLCISFPGCVCVCMFIACTNTNSINKIHYSRSPCIASPVGKRVMTNFPACGAFFLVWRLRVCSQRERVWLLLTLHFLSPLGARTLTFPSFSLSRSRFDLIQNKHKAPKPSAYALQH